MTVINSQRQKNHRAKDLMPEPHDARKTTQHHRHDGGRRALNVVESVDEEVGLESDETEFGGQES